ncbi:MAG: SdrD B-like domain-containing protein [Acidimicrobiales bacterium]
MRIVATLGLLVTSLVVLASSPARAAGETLTVVATQVDATATFDADDAAGHDSSATNGIVRTNDTLTYDVELRVADAAATGVTFTMTLPKGVELSAVPAFCTGAGSGLSPASLAAPVVPVTATSWTSLPQQTLTCNVGARTANSTFTYPIVTKVRPEVPNGTPLTLETVKATSTDVTTPVESNPLTATVSARAQFDLSKNSISDIENQGYLDNAANVVNCADPLGAPGATRRCFRYQASVLVSAPAGGKGISPLASTLTFHDDLTPTSLYGASVLSDPDWVAAGANAAAKYGAVLVSCPSNTRYQPGYKVGTTNPAGGTLTTTNAVRNSGTSSCTQAGGPGTQGTITLANGDYTAYTYPSQVWYPVGSATPADRAYVIATSVYIDIPVDAVTDLGTPNSPTNPTNWSLKWDNKYTDFNPVGIDGATNLPGANQAFNDHRGTTTVVQTQGGFDKWFSGVPGTVGNTAPADFNSFSAWEGPAASTGAQSGEGKILPGQQTLSTLAFSNSSSSTATLSSVGCDAWNNAELQLMADDYPTLESGVSLQRIPSNGAAVWLNGWRLDGVYAKTTPAAAGFQVQYGTGVGGPGAAATCDDASSPAGWFDDPAAVPGNDPGLLAQGIYSAVSRVRVRVAVPSGINGASWAAVSIGLRAVPTLPSGVILENYGNVKRVAGDVDMASILASSATWLTNNYVPETNAGAPGDRLTTTTALARIAKQVKDPSTGTYGTTTPAFTGGQTAEFKLLPTLTSPIQTGVTRPVKVEDCLPAGEIFLAATSSPAASVVSPTTPAGAGLTCTAGQTYVMWDLGPTAINQPITPITYSVRVARGAAAGVKVNNVLISAEGDTSLVSQRSAQASIQVQQPAGVVIDKYALTPLVEVNRPGETTLDPLLWQVDFTNVNTNPGPSDVDIIDALPKQGSGGTSFSGSLAFDHATVLAGNEPGQAVEVLYTKRATVDTDAGNTTNDATTGSTIWCSLSGSTFTRVLGGGTSSSCPASLAEVTGLRIRRPGVFGPSDQISVEIGMVPTGNAKGDTYVNEAAGRATGLALLVGPATAPETVVASTIGDFVWDDQDLDGIQDPGEPGIAGFEVTLVGKDSDGNAVGPLTTTTDASGHYSFTGLQSGSYTVTFDPGSLTAGQHFTLQDVGGNDLVDSDGDPTTGVVHVTLGANVTNLSIDQGVFTAAPKIAVTKYINGDDANAAPGVLVEPGADMIVTFDVHNTGNMTLDPVKLTDDKIATADISCPKTALAPDETMTCTATYPGPAAGTQHTNTATVTGTPVPLPDGTQLEDVTDDDPANAYGIVRKVTITKDLVGDPVPNGDGTYTVSYDVKVTNEGTQAATYDLDDQLHFGAGATVTGASVTSGPAGVTLDPTWDGATHTRIATGVDIPLGGVHTYRVEATAKVDPTAGSTATSDCTQDQGEDGTGFLNGATLTFGGTTTDVDACAPFPRTTFHKDLVGSPKPNGDGTTTITYDLVVTNDGAALDHYDLVDALHFGGNIAVQTATVANTAPGSITPDATWNGTSHTTVVSDQAIGAGASHTYRVTVTAKVDGAVTVGQSDCNLDQGEDGTGFLNGATLTVNGIDSEDQACAPAPNTSMTKALLGDPVVEADGSVTSTYAITVTNSGAGDDTYDLADDLRLGDGITVNSASVANTTPGTITTDPAWDGSSHTAIVADEPIAAGANHVYVVKVNATIGTTTTVTQADCTIDSGEHGTGFLNHATLTVNGQQSQDDACGTVDPVIELHKSLVGSPTQNADGSWKVTYDIDVSNTVAPNTYDLSDTLQFGAGITVDDASVTNTAPGSITPDAAWDGTSHTTIVSGQAIGAGATHTYRVVVDATVATTATTTATDCTVGTGENGSGFLNGAHLTTDAQTLDDQACAKAPNTSMTKVLLGDPVVRDDKSVDLTYAITVTNSGAGDDTYDLADDLRFGGGIAVNSASVANTSPGTITTDPAWDGSSHTAIVADEPIAAGATHVYVVKVNATIGTTTTVTQADCTVDQGEDGTGFLNHATLTVGQHHTTDQACGTVDPVIELHKSLVGSPAPNADGSWKVTYDIDVSNTVAPNTYDLSDGLRFGAGIVVVDASVSNTDPGTITTSASWDGQAHQGIVSGQAIGAGATHTYRVVVDATVATTATTTATDCTVGTGETGSGFLNGAHLTTDAQTLDDQACAKAPNLSMTKVLLGDPVVQADKSVDLTYAITVTNSGAGSGTYDLADDLRFGGGITVNGASVANTTPGTITTDPAWDGTSHTTVASGVDIAGAGSSPTTHTYVVKVNATMGTTTTVTQADCTLDQGEDGTGFLNHATLTVGQHHTTDQACGTVGTEVTVEKSVVGAPTANGDGTWTIDYDVVATNVGPAPGTYDLADQVTYGAGTSVIAASVSNAVPGTITTNPDWDGTNDQVIVTGEPIAVGGVHRYRVEVQASVAPDITTTATDCTVSTTEHGTGFLNTATLDDGTHTSKDDACAPIPSIRIVKKLDGSPTLSKDGRLSVTYALTVTNTGSGSGTYDLRDRLRWGKGLDVTGASVVATPAGESARPSWDGRSDTLIAADVAIPGEATHVWKVRVTGTITTSLTTASGDCTVSSGEQGTGLLNTATVDANGATADSSACGWVRPPKVVSTSTTSTGSLARTGFPFVVVTLAGAAMVGLGFLLVGGTGRRRRAVR